MSDLLQTLPTYDSSYLCRSRFWQRCPFLQGNPNLLVFTFPDGFVCNLLQVDQLVPSIKGICKTVRETSEPRQPGTAGATSSFRRAEQSSCIGVRGSRQATGGKAFLMHPFSLDKQMPKDTVEFLLWERSQFDLTNLLGIFCGK